jgi:hypothetical protein
MFLSNPGLSLLFNTADTTIGFAQRSDPNNHHAMMPSPSGPPSAYVIPGDSSTYYDMPIAVLVGPGAVSSGDQVALRMKFHQMTRFFGKSTTAAFNAPTGLNLNNSDWYSRYAVADAYLVSDPNQYLTHDEFTVDEEVWLKPDDVANGYDTVVEEAIAWINSLTVDLDDQISEAIPSTYYLFQNYPNPFNPATTINYSLPIKSRVELVVYNTLGEEVIQLVNRENEAGSYSVELDANGLSSGIYFYRLQAGDFIETKKMMLMK